MSTRPSRRTGIAWHICPVSVVRTVTSTCWNWTRNTDEGCPRVGHSWCGNANCMPAGSGSGTNWMSVYNEAGCAPGGTLVQMGFPKTRQVGAYGGYGGFYCFAVTPNP